MTATKNYPNNLTALYARLSQENALGSERKDVGIRKRTPTIVNKFVKKTLVHAPDKSSGHRRQKI